MSYISNQYNYATPLSSVAGLTQETSVVSDKKYFTLSDNSLDGSYFPVTGDVGLWSASISDSDGSLIEPFVVTVTENLTISTIRFTFSQYVYPVAFTVQFYSGTSLLYTVAETANNQYIYTKYLPKALVVTHYVLTVLKVNKPNTAARLYNSYNPPYLVRSDTLNVYAAENKNLVAATYVSSSDIVTISQTVTCECNESVSNTIQQSDEVSLKLSDSGTVDKTIHSADSLRVSTGSATLIRNSFAAYDSLRIGINGSTHIRNTVTARDSLKVTIPKKPSHIINTSTVSDSLSVSALGSSELTNIHSVMKAPSRRVYGKVYVTYTDPITESATVTVGASSTAYNSDVNQVLDGDANVENKYFTLYDNDLSGDYVVSSADSQVGWSSGVISDANGYFAAPPYLEVSLASRVISQLVIHLDDSHGNLLRDFDVAITTISGETYTTSVVDNSQKELRIEIPSSNVSITKIRITIKRVQRPYSPATIVDVPALSTFLYAGYQDNSELISISMLEELTYDDDVEALGGVSANEVTVVFDNSSKMFNSTNRNSPIAGQLKRNRKIVPYLGAEIIPGIIEWYTLGTYWSYEWDVPYNSLTAKVVGFDTLGLLDTTSFKNHTMRVDNSLGELIDYVLNDAKRSLNFIEWIVDEALYDVHIPYAWFAASSHTAALRKISQCYPMHIYCDRSGRICAKPQKLHLDDFYDVWSDSTNVYDKSYSSLNTTLPNIINVKVVGPTLLFNDELVKDELVFDVSTVKDRTLMFNKPYVGDLVGTIDMDDSVQYTYEVYSWGIQFSFTGTGKVRSIICSGTALDTTNSSVITKRDENSIFFNGAVTRDISADFIQTSDLAMFIIDRLVDLSQYDKFDAEVEYRGNIALSINDPILLLDGVAPDNRYNIKRHQLTWDGGLSGVADLNT